MSLSWQTGSKPSVHVNAVRKTRPDRQTGGLRDRQTRRHGGQRVSPQRFLPLGDVLNASLWPGRRRERADGCVDEVRAGGDRALPDLPSSPLRSGPLRSSPLLPPGGGHTGPAAASVCLLCAGRKDKHPSHETGLWRARQPAVVLWTLVSRHASRDGDETAFTTGESLGVHARNHDEAPIILVVLHYPETTSAAAHEGTNATQTLEIPQRFMDFN